MQFSKYHVIPVVINLKSYLCVDIVEDIFCILKHIFVFLYPRDSYLLLLNLHEIKIDARHVVFIHVFKVPSLT